LDGPPGSDQAIRSLGTGFAKTLKLLIGWVDFIPELFSWVGGCIMKTFQDNAYLACALGVREQAFHLYPVIPEFKGFALLCFRVPISDTTIFHSQIYHLFPR